CARGANWGYFDYW
nr:immunoglobulin heavy chain junction region [Mus musculus]